jgi:hypothetical protein
MAEMNRSRIAVRLGLATALVGGLGSIGYGSFRSHPQVNAPLVCVEPTTGLVTVPPLAPPAPPGGFVTTVYTGLGEQLPVTTAPFDAGPPTGPLPLPTPGPGDLPPPPTVPPPNVFTPPPQPAFDGNVFSVQPIGDGIVVANGINGQYVGSLTKAGVFEPAPPLPGNLVQAVRAGGSTYALIMLNNGYSVMKLVDGAWTQSERVSSAADGRPQFAPTAFAGEGAKLLVVIGSDTMYSGASEVRSVVSLDRGAHWSSANVPAFGQIAVTGDAFFVIPFAAEMPARSLLRSTDGVSWTEINIPFAASPMRSWQMMPSSGAGQISVTDGLAMHAYDAATSAWTASACMFGSDPDVVRLSPSVLISASKTIPSVQIVFGYMRADGTGSVSGVSSESGTQVQFVTSDGGKTWIKVTLSNGAPPPPPIPSIPPPPVRTTAPGPSRSSLTATLLNPAPTTEARVEPIWDWRTCPEKPVVTDPNAVTYPSTRTPQTVPRTTYVATTMNVQPEPVYPSTPPTTEAMVDNDPPPAGDGIRTALGGGFDLVDVGEHRYLTDETKTPLPQGQGRLRAAARTPSGRLWAVFRSSDQRLTIREFRQSSWVNVTQLERNVGAGYGVDKVRLVASDNSIAVFAGERFPSGQADVDTLMSFDSGKTWTRNYLGLYGSAAAVGSYVYVAAEGPSNGNGSIIRTNTGVDWSLIRTPFDCSLARFSLSPSQTPGWLHVAEEVKEVIRVYDIDPENPVWDGVTR